MAKEESRPQQNTAPPKKTGLLRLLLWRLPWHIAGILLASLFLSLMVEYAGLIFWWPEQGAQHAREMMETELRFLSSDFTRSLVMSQPSVTVMSWVRDGYRWFTENAGLSGTLSAGNGDGNLFTRTVATSGAWLAVQFRVFLEATLYLTVVFVVRVSILFLSVPLFVMAAAVASGSIPECVPAAIGTVVWCGTDGTGIHVQKIPLETGEISTSGLKVFPKT